MQKKRYDQKSLLSVSAAYAQLHSTDIQDSCKAQSVQHAFELSDELQKLYKKHTRAACSPRRANKFKRHFSAQPSSVHPAKTANSILPVVISQGSSVSQMRAEHTSLSPRKHFATRSAPRTFGKELISITSFQNRHDELRAAERASGSSGNGQSVASQLKFLAKRTVPTPFSMPLSERLSPSFEKPASTE